MLLQLEHKKDDSWSTYSMPVLRRTTCLIIICAQCSFLFCCRTWLLSEAFSHSDSLRTAWGVEVCLLKMQLHQSLLALHHQQNRCEGCYSNESSCSGSPTCICSIWSVSGCWGHGGVVQEVGRWQQRSGIGGPGPRVEYWPGLQLSS